MPRPQIFTACLMILSLLPPVALAAEIRIAVAANFASTLKDLARDFALESGHRVQISSGSTGRHYAQIRNGAAFDVFLAADSARPARLEAEGIGVPGSRFTYAVGQLVLWAPGEAELGSAEEYLNNNGSRPLAIANPRLAPYGLAAQQVLQAWQLWERLQPRLVRGENIAQAYQFVASGNAPAGLVALSQLLAGNKVTPGTYQVIPDHLHGPIRQQALLLRNGDAAEAFLKYLQGEAANRVILAAGYRVQGDT